MAEALPSTATVTVRAAAKINLHLGVGAARDDGFHPLSTVYQAIGIYDDVTVQEADGWSLDIAADDHVDASAVPVEDNLVERAARLLTGSEEEPRAAVRIHKAIPVAGGMAGGSADAAATLVALDRLWDLGTPDDELLLLAARLGSDVPFALIGGTALGSGRGELVEPLEDHGTWWWVAVPAAGGLSTPEVYRHFDRLFPEAAAEPAGPDAVLSALVTRDPAVLARALHNDLQPAALDLRPDLATLIEEGEAAGALRGMVSGSGPTCVFLAADGDSARFVGAELAARGHDVTLVAPAPVSGATVVSW